MLVSRGKLLVWRMESFAVSIFGSTPSSGGVVQKIVERLSDEIRSGGLRPGEKLSSERELGDRFGVGRSSVREALRILGSQGLIQVQMGRGSFVADFTAPAPESVVRFWDRRHDVSLRELMEIRLSIEPQIAAFAARRGGEDCLGKLKSSLADLREQISNKRLGGRVFADTAFHDQLARAADNSLFFSINRNIEPMLLDTRRLGLLSLERSTRVLDAHERIYRAVVERNPRSAAREMWAHIVESATFMEVDFDLDFVDLYPRDYTEEGMGYGSGPLHER